MGAFPWCPYATLFQDAMHCFALGAIHGKTWPRCRSKKKNESYMAVSKSGLLTSWLPRYPHVPCRDIARRNKYPVALQKITLLSVYWLEKLGNQSSIWFGIVVLWVSGWGIMLNRIYIKLPPFNTRATDFGDDQREVNSCPKTWKQYFRFDPTWRLKGFAVI